jgi:cytochrome c-type biogenesis protein CcmE
VARKRNPARLVIALSVAAVLAVFLLYTSIAGGGGTPSVTPSELGGKQGLITLAGRVQPGYSGDSYAGGLRFRLRDPKGESKQTVTVVYTGSVSDQFRAGRDVSVKGQLRNGVFVAVKDSLVTKCPSKYTAKKTS